jgi:hypothetical protein
MASPSIVIKGKISKIAESDAQRLNAFILRCYRIIVSVPIQADGTFRLSLPRTTIQEESAYGFTLAVAPATASAHLDHLPNVPMIALKRQDLEKTESEYQAPAISLSAEVLKLWWTWCRWYCVSGTLVGPDGCAVPGAEVTVYSVGYSGFGYSKIPRATVATGPNGSFTACFEWCSCVFCFPCWSCRPIWWLCWPWWWEWDMLHVIEALEKVPVPGMRQVATLANQATLIRPDATALVRGQGFGIAREAFAPDASRTALIKSKLANPRLREIFPWWWWCCDDPNIVFSATQGGNVILDENPAIDTRWCFEDGGQVTLVGNSESETLCTRHCPPESGFVWTNVGVIDVDDIGEGYANVPAWTAASADYQDLVFSGSLDIFGEFAPGSNVSFYQVLLGQWAGNPARSGIAPAAGGTPLLIDLYRKAFMEDSTHTIVTSAMVKMGPFTQNGVPGLYATEQARAAGPIAGLPAVPLPLGGAVIGWSDQGMMVSTSSQNLIGGATTGAVNLTVAGYDAAANPVALVPDSPLTLTIDNTPLTSDAISLVAFKADGTPAILNGTGECPAYDVGPGGYVQITTTVSDSMGHLFEYYVDAEYGSGSSVVVAPPGTRGYRTNPLVFAAPAGVCLAGDPDTACKSWVGGTEVMYFPNTPGGLSWTPPFSLANEPPDCCYLFLIRLAKRATNGYSLPSLGDGQFQTVALKFST